MALVLKDRIKETSSTTGTGTLTLGGAVDGFRSFADIGDGNTTYYCIADGNNFEVGIGTYTASGTTLARTTVLQTSAGNTNKITCTGNQKVFVTQPASKAAYLDASNELVVASTALSSIQQRWTKTAISNQTVFNGAADNSGPTLAVNSSSHVFLNGIFLKETTDYALSGGTTVTLTAGATVNDIVEVITFTPLSSSITGISDGDIPVFTSGVADNDFLKVAGTSIEGRSASEVLSDIGGQSALTFGISSGNVPTFTSGVADNDFLKIDGTTVEGRSASEVLSDIGGQASLTFGISNTNAVKIDSSSVADDEYARFTANGLESRSTSEVLSDIGGQASLTFGISNTNAVKIDSTSVADDEYARFTANGLESRSTAEVLSDIGALSTSSASSTYLTQSNASSTYLTQSSASSTYAPLSGATFTGNIILPQTGVLAFNSVADEYITATASNMYIGVDNGYHIHIDGVNDHINFRIDNANVNGNLHYNSNDYFALESNSYLSLQANVSSTQRSLILSNTYFRPFLADNGTIDLGTSGGKFKDLHLSGIGYASSSFRAPIFYDSGNTTYYCDPASSSNLYQVRSNGGITAGTISGLNSMGQIGLYATAPYISFHSGTLDRTAYIQESGGAFYLNEATFTSMSGSARAPLFYDVSNTAYYVDPYSTSVLNNINFYGLIQSAGSAGSSGQVLTSNGSGSRPTWQDAGGGAWEVIGNYTGTNVASVDFINGTNGFVWNNTYKRIKMYGNAIMNSGSATQGSVMISPLVSSGSSGNVVLSNLCFYIQQWMEGYPEFNASLTTSNEYRGQSNNTSGGYIGYFFIGTRSGSTNLGNNFFSTTIGGTTYYSGRRNSYASVELDINSKGITGSTSWNMFTHTYADHPGFYFYPRRIHGQTSSFGYTEKGLRFALSNTSYRFDYDFTFVGLKP